MFRIRRPFGDVLASIAALTVLVAVLVSVDERVRSQVSDRLTADGVRTELSGAGDHLLALGSVIVEAARYQTIEHAPLMILVCSACVLVVFMLRT